MSTAPHGPASRPAAIVVVNFGSHALLAVNLPPTSALGGLRVVVVDNLSTAHERAAVTALAAERRWELLTPPANLGFGTGMNLGAAHAMAGGARTLVLLNPDLRAEPDVLRALADACLAEPMTMVGPRIERPDGSTWFTGGQVLVDEGRTVTAGASAQGPTGWLTGACLALSSDLWSAAGGFDDDYFLYWEDVDLSWRCRAAGGRIAVRPDLVVVHDVGGTQGAGKSSTYLRCNARNRLVFAAKHLDRRARLVWAARSATYARLLLRRADVRGRPAADVARAVRAVATGTLDGLWFLARDGVARAAGRRD